MTMNATDREQRHQVRMQRKKTVVDTSIERANRDQGLLLVLTGNGKGKSSSAFGMVARALGHGMKVGVAQFIKGRSDTGEEHCRQLLYGAAGDADLILIEGVMGLYDGERSSADLATLFDIPVLAVIDGSAMAQTFGAIAHGLATYRPDLPFAGMFANRVAGDRHYEMLAESLPPGVTAYGWLARNADIALPERHLGLVQAAEVGDLDTRIARTAAALYDINPALPPEVSFTAPAMEAVTPQLTGVRIAVARDEAFAFLYRANLELLQALGAQLIFFSPLNDDTLPQAGALYLPGGYPELHLDRLASNESMKAALRAFHADGRPIVAECGGMLYLLESLTDAQGRNAAMAGLFPGHAVMQTRLANLGLHSAVLPEGELKGHTFHHSTMTTDTAPVTHSRSARHHSSGEPVYRQRRLTASYLHWYFPSNPTATAGLFLP